MKNIVALICFSWLLFACNKESKLVDVLYQNWCSSKVQLSGNDITNLTQYTLTLTADGTISQQQLSTINGQQIVTNKKGVFEIANDQGIVVTFDNESEQKWTIKSYSEQSLQVEFHRNGEIFLIDFLKK